MTIKKATQNYRDEVFERIERQKLDKIYWAQILKKAKVNTPEAVDANSKIGILKEAIRKDKDFLKILDKKLKGYK